MPRFKIREFNRQYFNRRPHPEDTLTGAELRWLRGSCDASQDSFALLLGIAPNTVARYEMGKLPIRRPFARLVVYAVSELCDVTATETRTQLVKWRKRQRHHERRITAPARNASA